MKKIGAVAFFAVLTFAFAFATIARADSPSLDALASKMAGTDVHVICFPANRNNLYRGYVLFNGDIPEHIIHLVGDECGALQNVLTPGPRTKAWTLTFPGSLRIGEALMALAHEATHIALASKDEGIVECVAYGNVSNYARLLPLTWKARRAVYNGAAYDHRTKRTRFYRSVC